MPSAPSRSPPGRGWSAEGARGFPLQHPPKGNLLLLTLTSAGRLRYKLPGEIPCGWSRPGCPSPSFKRALERVRSCCSAKPRWCPGTSDGAETGQRLGTSNDRNSGPSPSASNKMGDPESKAPCLGPPCPLHVDLPLGPAAAVGSQGGCSRAWAPTAPSKGAAALIQARSQQ